VGNDRKSDLAKATQNPNIDEKMFFIKEMCVDQGPSIKRFRDRSQGRSAGIKKRTSHITIILDEQ